jgi:hypothetical protein
MKECEGFGVHLSCIFTNGNFNSEFLDGLYMLCILTGGVCTIQSGD